MKTNNGRIGEQFYRGTSEYGKSCYQSFQTTSQDEIQSSNQGEERRSYQSSFAEIEEKTEMSPCYFGEEDRGREDKIEKERANEKNS